jgi:CheY-like chemotaxis protein
MAQRVTSTRAAPTETKVDILLVDDDATKRFAMKAVLAPLGQSVVEAASGPDALRQLLKQDFAAILLDVRMPGMDGFETAQLIRQRPRSELTPIIFVTALDRAETDMGRGYDLGAVDFVFAPSDHAREGDGLRRAVQGAAGAPPLPDAARTAGAGTDDSSYRNQPRARGVQLFGLA